MIQNILRIPRERTIYMIVGFVLIFDSCSSGIRFVVCPNEIAEKMRVESDVGERKELLFGLDYRVIIVHKTVSNEILTRPINI
jgi:hypothetical protein